MKMRKKTQLRLLTPICIIRSACVYNTPKVVSVASAVGRVRPQTASFRHWLQNQVGAYTTI